MPTPFPPEPTGQSTQLHQPRNPHHRPQPPASNHRHHGAAWIPADRRTLRPQPRHAELPAAGPLPAPGAGGLDGAGFSHDLLEHIAAGGGTKGRDWEFSVGWSCTAKEMDAIQRLPKGAWTAGIDPNGDLVPDTFVADLTGLLDLGRWHDKIPDLRIIVRDEPLHPRYRKRATEWEKQLGRRYQLIATNARVGQVACLDARHRSHVHVENDVTQAKALGLDRWTSWHWAINVTWTQIVAPAANLLACLRHLALPRANSATRPRHCCATDCCTLPARLTRGQRTRWLHLPTDWPWTDDLINTWRAVKALPAPT